ncbi:hypothetical protein Mal52_21990 [Symmachiella dynata]|uniref:Uncharacterized protein n=1 Tax=Symmachiella dynata TaxID=2527995 RepID=A0A517ZMK9_9PLAN|nr:hypothetical protein Mal52_21990 [Symmachiella dynata]
MTDSAKKSRLPRTGTLVFYDWHCSLDGLGPSHREQQFQKSFALTGFQLH